MINKEIILGNGNIVKDFSDRNIPQNSHNQVCVSFLIPSNQFNDYDDYSVFTAVSRVVGNVETPLNALVLTASKSITIEGINYIKFSCVLSLDYTNVLGELRFSPYIQATIHTDSVLDDLDNDSEDEVITETLLSQNSYTNCKLNIIKAVRIQEDASLEEASTATTLAGQINSKKIYYNAEWNSLTDASESMLYYNIATSYNPSVALYNGSIVAIKNQNVVSFYFPYLNGANVELFKMTNEGVFYKISGISRTGEGTEQSPYVYNATKQKLTYTKAEIDTKESAIYNALDLKVDKTQTVNGHALSGDITITKGDVGLGNVANYGVESTPTSSGESLYITSKGVYDALQLVYTAISGCATDDDLTTINNRLDSIEAIIGSDDGDDDNVINTLKEVIVVLNGLDEGANLLDLINAKANQSDLTALNNQINGENGIKDKVDLLSERTNAYMEIKNSLGTIDISTEAWEENTGDTDYPYKWELTNGYLEGAVNCIVVYSKDSDTSMLSATTGIDEENGKLIIYASELPSDTISIEKIAVFNDLNAYINYSNEIVQQVMQNTSAISDINNTKLPQYVKSEEENTPSGWSYALQSLIGRKATTGGLQLKTTRKNTNSYSEISMPYGALQMKVHNNDGTETTLKVDKDGVYKNNIPIGVLFTSSTDATENDGVYALDVSGISDIGVNDYIAYINSGAFTTLYQVVSITSFVATLNVVGSFGGGGKQLYEHNIRIYVGPTTYVRLTIRNDNNTLINDYDKIKNYLSLHLFTSWDNCRECTGSYASSSYIWGIYADGNIIKVCAGDNAITISDTATISDHPVAL